MREFEFEDRYYQVTKSKDFVLRIRLGVSGFMVMEKRKTNRKSLMGLIKIPGTNYCVVDPYVFQDWFKELCNAK